LLQIECIKFHKENINRREGEGRRGKQEKEKKENLNLNIRRETGEVTSSNRETRRERLDSKRVKMEIRNIRIKSIRRITTGSRDIRENNNSGTTRFENI